MSYLEELLPEFRKGAKIKMKDWNKSFYYEMRNGKVYNQNGHRINKFSHQALFENVWEFYSESIDWQYIINHKCLCWFWERDDAKQIRYLTAYRPEENYPFVGYLNGYGYCSYSHCRPVSRDEVTFYEDKKDAEM